MVVLSFISCGGGSGLSTKKDKSTTHKVLNYVGMPTHQVIALCIDTDEDGECGLLEVQDSIYSAEIEDETTPIVVQAELGLNQDLITLLFNGFNNKEKKEISILESIIDTNAISEREANPFKTLETSHSQGNFYFIQENTLVKNYYKLKEQGLDNKSAMLGTLHSMGETLKNNQEKPNQINDCGDDQLCALTIINKLRDDLSIIDKEALEIDIPIPVTNDETRTFATGDSDFCADDFPRDTCTVIGNQLGTSRFIANQVCSSTFPNTYYQGTGQQNWSSCDETSDCGVCAIEVSETYTPSS